MRIGLFGGSFNPPHVCHTLVTVWALQTRSIDQVWWIPTFEHAFDKDLAAYEHRRRMCELALRDIERVEISDIERDIGGESRTIDTVLELERRRPDDEFSLIVGSDILEETDNWKRWDDLMEHVDLVVVRRSEYEDQLGGVSAGFRLPNVSSTEIRQSIRRQQREWVGDWVGRPVLAYIDEHGLYRDGSDADG